MKLTLILFLIISSSAVAQNSPIVQIGGDINFNIYSPYTYDAIDNETSSYEKQSSNQFLNIDFRVLSLNKFFISTGVSYKRIKYTRVDALKTYGYTNFSNNSYVIHSYSDPADLISKSHSLGVSIEGSYFIHSTDRINMSLSCKSSFYFFEWYNAYYFSTDVLQGSSNPQFVAPQPLITELPRTFFLSSINTAIIYRITLLPKTGRTTFTGKLSLGANIYSDWEQFKRYAWLGVGLEIGFLGKEKTK